TAIMRPPIAQLTSISGLRCAVSVGIRFEQQIAWLELPKMDEGIRKPIGGWSAVRLNIRARNGTRFRVRREHPQFFYSRTPRCHRSRMVVASAGPAECEGPDARPPARPRADDPGSAGRRDRPPRRGTTPARGSARA